MTPTRVVLAVRDAAAEQLIRSVANDISCTIEDQTGINAATSLLNNDQFATLVICDPSSFHELRADFPNVAALLIADRGESQQTIDAMKHGALDCLFSPVDRAELAARIREAVDIISQPRLNPSARRGMVAEAGSIIGQSPAMQEVYKFVGLVAPREVNVLITGESGTGKEVVARAIHDNSKRCDHPFIPVHCAAIPESLLESELFGHEKGAFTGADAQRAGKFEQARGGTLFLDEVGDIPPAIQAKLLRILQDHTFTRLGGNQNIHTDVRILAATHRPLEALIADGGFREDLYYRLKVATIHLPPLRQREVDAVLLAHFFAEQHNAALGSNIQHFSPETVAALLRYPWPGNVRELENVIKSALVVARGTVMRPEFLPRAIMEASGQATDPNTSGSKDASLPSTAQKSINAWLDDVLADTNMTSDVMGNLTDQLHRALILRALEQFDGQLAQTAVFLGISRTTLRKKMRDLSISVRRQAESESADFSDKA